jgi:peptide/nickel transport system substrate-binding protein
VTIPEVENPNTYIMMPLVTNKAPFDNVDVRRAMAYATPYQQIVDNVYRGNAVRNGPGFLLRNAPNYSDAGFPDYTFDPAKAKQILADAGFPDGVSFSLAVRPSRPGSTSRSTRCRRHSSPSSAAATRHRRSSCATTPSR